MNLPDTQNTVHESETQRQFVRLPIPAQVQINGQTYEVRDLSSGGLAVEGVDSKIKENTVLQVVMTLPFTSFSLEVSIEAQVLYYDEANKVLGCQFVNISPDQVSLLNHVIKSFMAGEIVKSGALLNAAARENFVSKRKKATTSEIPELNVKKQLPRLILFGLLGLFAFAFIIGNIYDSMFVLKSNNSVVQGHEIHVRTSEQGVFISKIAADTREVANREELGSINNRDVKSPCDCAVTEIHRQDGEFVVPGDKIVSLVPKESAPWIVSMMKPADASRLGLNNPAKIFIAGTKVEIPGKVASIKTDGSVNPFYGPAMVQVRIVPDQKLPIDLIGRPAKVVFEIK